MPVPNSFANVTTSIPLSQLDANFNTPITLGNTAIQLGNTVTTLNNMTLANVTVTSGNVTITNVTVTTANVTTANIATAVITTANVTTANITTGNVSGNLTFTGTGNRITGDFSNATIANRAMFQTSSAGSNSVISAIPNGAATQASFLAAGNSDPTNASYIQMLANGTTDTRLISTFFGTGTFLPMTFYTGGGERMRIDTAGNLGLGVTPSAWATYKAFSVGNSGNSVAGSGTEIHLTANCYYNAGWKYNTTERAARFSIGENYNDFKWYIAPSGTAGNAITFTQAMTLDASGNLLVNATSNGGGKLEVKQAATNESGIWVYSSATDSNGRFYCDNSAVGIAASFSSTGSFLPIVFRTSATERARITSGGDLLVGTTTSRTGMKVIVDHAAQSVGDYSALMIRQDGGTPENGGQVAFINTKSGVSNPNKYIRVDNSGLFQIVNSAYTTIIFSLTDGGNLTINGATATKASGTTWANPSDLRLKDNVRDYEKGLAELMQVRVREWEYNGKGGTTEGMRGLGVVADEVMTVLPNTVDEYQAKLNKGDEQETAIKRFDATEITWLLVRSLQEQQAMIDELKAKVAALESA